MRFNISLEQRHTISEYLIKVEKDDIFIAFPKEKTKRSETIFLTRVEGAWVGDCSNKNLVKKLGAQIDIVYYAMYKVEG